MRVRKLHALEIARFWGETQQDSFYWWDKSCCGYKELFLPCDMSFMFCVDRLWKHQRDYIVLCEGAGRRMLALFIQLWYIPSPKKCLLRTQGTISLPGSSLVHASWKYMVCISPCFLQELSLVNQLLGIRKRKKKKENNQKNPKSRFSTWQCCLYLLQWELNVKITSFEDQEMTQWENITECK